MMREAEEDGHVDEAERQAIEAAKAAVVAAAEEVKADTTEDSAAQVCTLPRRLGLVRNVPVAE